MLKATLTKYFCAKFLIHLLSGGEKCYKPSCYDHDRFQVKLKCRALVSPKACEKNIPNLKNIFSCKETFLQHGCSEFVPCQSGVEFNFRKLPARVVHTNLEVNQSKHDHNKFSNLKTISTCLTFKGYKLYNFKFDYHLFY